MKVWDTVSTRSLTGLYEHFICIILAEGDAPQTALFIYSNPIPMYCTALYIRNKNSNAGSHRGVVSPQTID